MDVNELLEQKSVTKYWLSKNSGVPYTTVCDICSGRTKLENCSVRTVYKIAEVFGVPMEAILDFSSDERSSFELYKSGVCHRVKEMGDIDFIIDTLEKDEIGEYYRRGWYNESLYLLAMLDYVSRMNGVEVCTKYDDLRCCKLKEPIYPAGILTAAIVCGSDEPKQQALRNSDIKDALQRGNYEAVYLAVMKEEKNSRDMLVRFEENYPGVATESNVNEILEALKTRKPSVTGQLRAASKSKESQENVSGISSGRKENKGKYYEEW